MKMTIVKVLVMKSNRFKCFGMGNLKCSNWSQQLAKSTNKLNVRQIGRQVSWKQNLHRLGGKTHRWVSLSGSNARKAKNVKRFPNVHLDRHRHRERQMDRRKNRQQTTIEQMCIQEFTINPWPNTWKVKLVQRDIWMLPKNLLAKKQGKQWRTCKFWNDVIWGWGIPWIITWFTDYKDVWVATVCSCMFPKVIHHDSRLLRWCRSRPGDRISTTVRSRYHGSR